MSIHLTNFPFMYKSSRNTQSGVLLEPVKHGKMIEENNEKTRKKDSKKEGKRKI